MARRKTPKGWKFRRQINREFKTASDEMRFEKLFESALAEAERKFRERVTPHCTIRGKLQEFLSDSGVGLGRRRSSYGTLVLHERRLLMFAKAFRNKPLDAISRKQIERWMKKRIKDGVQPDTVNADLISLRAFARWAQMKEYAPDVLPLFRVKSLDVPGKIPGTNRKPPRAREFDEIVDVVMTISQHRPDIALFLQGMAFFGLRPKAVAMLRREDARPPRGESHGRLFTVGIKGERDRDIAAPAGTPRGEWLRTCLAFGRKLGRTGPRAPLVPNQNGQAGWTTATLDIALKRLCRRHKIRMTPYIIRHTCMTWLLREAGIAPANSQHYAGHERIDTQNAYNSLVGREAEPAYRAVEAEWVRLAGLNKDPDAD